MKGRAGKLLRRDSAIERLTKTIAAHEAGVELTTKILEDKKLSKAEEMKLVNDCLQIYKSKNLSFSLDRFETIVNQPFDSVGSLSYINEQAKRRREE